MITEVKALDESRYHVHLLIVGLSTEERPVRVVQWLSGTRAKAWHLMLSNPEQATYFEQLDLVTGQSRNLALVTPEIVEMAEKHGVLFEVIEEVM